MTMSTRARNSTKIRKVQPTQPKLLTTFERHHFLRKKLKPHRSRIIPHYRLALDDTLRTALKLHSTAKADRSFSSTYINDTFWHAKEKELFFRFVGKCHREQSWALMKEKLPGKTQSEIIEYYEILKEASEDIKNKGLGVKWWDIEASMETPQEFVELEDALAVEVRTLEKNRVRAHEQKYEEEEGAKTDLVNVKYLNKITKFYQRHLGTNIKCVDVNNTIRITTSVHELLTELTANYIRKFIKCEVMKSLNSTDMTRCYDHHTNKLKVYVMLKDVWNFANEVGRRPLHKGLILNNLGKRLDLEVEGEDNQSNDEEDSDISSSDHQPENEEMNGDDEEPVEHVFTTRTETTTVKKKKRNFDELTLMLNKIENENLKHYDNTHPSQSEPSSAEIETLQEITDYEAELQLRYLNQEAFIATLKDFTHRHKQLCPEYLSQFYDIQTKNDLEELMPEQWRVWNYHQGLEQEMTNDSVSMKYKDTVEYLDLMNELGLIVDHTTTTTTSNKENEIDGVKLSKLGLSEWQWRELIKEINDFWSTTGSIPLYYDLIEGLGASDDEEVEKVVNVLVKKRIGAGEDLTAEDLFWFSTDFE